MASLVSSMCVVSLSQCSYHAEPLCHAAIVSNDEGLPTIALEDSVFGLCSPVPFD